MEKPTILTSEGLKKYEEELAYLKDVKRIEVAEKIKEARSFGDLSENAEYDAAKKEKAELEERITRIENILKNVTVVEEDEISTDTVTIGSKVTIYDTEEKEELVLQIVGSNEADPFNDKISHESPVGAALLGKKKGKTVTITTPDGSSVKYKILNISK